MTIFHKHPPFIFLLPFWFLLLPVSCVSFDDATQAVTFDVQLSTPAALGDKVDLNSKTIRLLLGTQEITQRTDDHGRATFINILPGYYDISVAWTIDAAAYTMLTGSEEVVRGASFSGSLNKQLISGNRTVLLPTHLSVDRDLVIGKIYYAASKDNNNRNYRAGTYIELYNQSDKPVDVAGLYIGLVESDATPAYTLADLHVAFADSVILLKQVFRIPDEGQHMVAPGGTVLIVNSAVDHRTNNDRENDLTQADYEAKDTQGRYRNNPDVPALKVVYLANDNLSNMNLVQSGPSGVVIFRTREDIAAWAKVYKFGKTTGTQWLCCPVRDIVDGVEVLKNKVSGIDVSHKRLYNRIDAGYTFINAISGWTGEVVCRKTAHTTADGRKILADTNNSSHDFKVSNDIKPRTYGD